MTMITNSELGTLNWQTEAIFDIVSDFWRNEELVRQYYPNYSFSSWRQIHKKYPVERFKVDWETGEELEKYVLADFSGEEIDIKTLNL